ncbi:MAG TPA: SPOR domain-containing protein [Bacteroidota bacterium]|nr:SPOR domain-containing protein [Bacteroidota bacterium]
MTKIVVLCALIVLSTDMLKAFTPSPSDSLPPARKEKLSTFEKSFKPSEYDNDIELLHKNANQPRPIVDVPVESFASAEPDTVQGFRIQVFASNNYEEAVAVRNSLNLDLPVLWVYMVYDAPTYKVRVGDYTNRADANLAVDGFIDKGFKGAWVVPDRVVANPPPKPAAPIPADSTDIIGK